MNGIAFVVVAGPSSRQRSRRGSQIVLRPKIISSATRIAINSNRLVIPPVGMGSAEVIMSSRRAIAKLFSSNISVRSARVFLPGDSSHDSRSSLKG